MSDQLALAQRCRRCGFYPVPTLPECAELVSEALAALHQRRLAMPAVVIANLSLLATALPHHAGTCQPREAL